MILAADCGIRTFGWSVVTPRTGRVLELGELYQPNDPDLDDTIDRARRAWNQAQLLATVVGRHKITAIAGEAESLGGPPPARLAMAQALCLSWGNLAMLSVLLGVPLYSVRPKTWQRAIVPESGKSIDYEIVSARLADFVTGPAVDQLLAIPEGRRNHALDSVGVGVYTALVPHVTCVAGGPS